MIESKFTIISELKAQELANILNMYIVINKNYKVYAFKKEPTPGIKQWLGFKHPLETFPDSDYELPIKIQSNKPWNTSLFKPIGYK